MSSPDRHWVCSCCHVVRMYVCLYVLEVEGCLSDLQQSRAVMSYNRGVVFCVLKEHDKAKQCMIKVTSTSPTHGRGDLNSN